MDLPDHLIIFHQPVRLRIMGLMFKQRDISFTHARNALDLTDGNLASHTKRLADAGYLDARKVLTREGFESRFRITRAGSDAFSDYVQRLRGFLDEIPDPDPPAKHPPGTGTNPASPA